MRFLKLTSARLLPEWAVSEGIHIELAAPSEEPTQVTSGAHRLSPIPPLIEGVLEGVASVDERAELYGRVAQLRRLKNIGILSMRSV